MSQETIKTYQGSSIGASQCLVTLENFIGDMENADLSDGSTVDASDAVTAINGLIWEIERREAEVERLRTSLGYFVGCAYPVSTEINPRGHAWRGEDALDFALAEARVTL